MKARSRLATVFRCPDGAAAISWVVCAWFAIGCSTTRVDVATEPAADDPVPWSFARIVDEVEVRDEHGTPYAHSFLGGMNIPRPQLIDIDGDGDLDLFAQEVTGSVRFFENVGTRSDSRYVWRTDRFGDLTVGEWYRFVDMDDDGDTDLLTERPFSYISYYRNDGSARAAKFVLAADTLRDVNGNGIFSDRQNIPNVTDIDCDGQKDLFIGRLVGTVTRYEARSHDATGVPRFQLITEEFEDIEIVAQIGSRHGANTMAFGDIDVDGDQDLFWGDFFEPGLLFIENTGTCAEPSLRGEPVPFPIGDPLKTSGYNAPTFGDLDGDGDMDLLVGVLGGAYNPNHTTRGNLYYYERTSGIDFALRTRRFLTMIDVGSESIPTFVDLDDDGDLDLLLANKIDPDHLTTSKVYRFENTGTSSTPSFQLRGALEFDGLYHYAPAFGDMDGDGDIDLLMGSWRADVAYFRNDGTAAAPRFVLADSSLVKLTRGSNTTPALVDIDADGDLDLFVGEASGTINFYRNEGTAQSPVFELVSDEFYDIDVGRRSFPTFVDRDEDGDLDLVLGKEEPGLLYFRNAGSPKVAEFVRDSSFAIPVPAYSTPVFVDIDADGDLDFFSGGNAGGLVFYENRRR